MCQLWKDNYTTGGKPIGNDPEETGTLPLDRSATLLQPSTGDDSDPGGTMNFSGEPTQKTRVATKFGKLLETVRPMVQGALVGGFGGNWRVPGSGSQAAQTFFQNQVAQRMNQQDLALQRQQYQRELGVSASTEQRNEQQAQLDRAKTVMVRPSPADGNRLHDYGPDAANQFTVDLGPSAEQSKIDASNAAKESRAWVGPITSQDGRQYRLNRDTGETQWIKEPGQSASQRPGLPTDAPGTPESTPPEDDEKSLSPQTTGPAELGEEPSSMANGTFTGGGDRAENVNVGGRQQNDADIGSAAAAILAANGNNPDKGDAWINAQDPKSFPGGGADLPAIRARMRALAENAGSIGMEPPTAPPVASKYVPPPRSNAAADKKKQNADISRQGDMILKAAKYDRDKAIRLATGAPKGPGSIDPSLMPGLLTYLRENAKKASTSTRQPQTDVDMGHVEAIAQRAMQLENGNVNAAISRVNKVPTSTISNQYKKEVIQRMKEMARLAKTRQRPPVNTDKNGNAVPMMPTSQ